MSQEKSDEHKRELDASEETLALAMQRHADGAKLLKAQKELLTPKGRAELEVVDSIESAGRFVRNLVRAEEPQGGNAGEMAASASFAKTQLQAAQWVLETAMGLSVAQSKRDVLASLQGQAQVMGIGDALARRLAAKQKRPAIVDAAIPAQADNVSQHTAHVKGESGGIPGDTNYARAYGSAEHTSVVDTQSQSAAANSVSDAADSGKA